MDVWIASSIVALHLVFVVFVVLGGLLVLHRRWWAWLHIPAAVWAVLVEWNGWICPLTPLENAFRYRAGKATYGTDFVERYLLPLLYPDTLSRRHQVWLGTAVLLLNLAVYAWIGYRYHRES